MQHNSEIIAGFQQLIKPFLNWRGQFSSRKYHDFFIKEKEENINKFYSNAQEFVNDLIIHIHQQKLGKCMWSKYFIDLTILLASNMDTAFRAQSVDNRRTSVDVTSFNLNSHYMKEIECVRQEFQKNNSKLYYIIVPTDFTLLYNVGDMLTVGFDLNNRKFIYPKLIEVKEHKKDWSTYKQDIHRQQKREFGQAMRFLELHAKYDFFKSLSLTPNLYGRPTYITNCIVKRLLNKSSFIKIDDTITLESTGTPYSKRVKNLWILNILEEVRCGNIIPSIFKGLDIRLFESLMESNTHIYLLVSIQSFRKHLKNLDYLSNVDNHHSPYEAWIYFGAIRLSMASLLHLKYRTNNLQLALFHVHKFHAQKIVETKNAEARYYKFSAD